MATASVHAKARPADVELVDRWFRALDQRSIYLGLREWCVQVTGILADEGVLWIQMADESRTAGSVVLRVTPTTPVDQAVCALQGRSAPCSSSFPTVINATTTCASIN
jgi:hypothetical protein